MLRVMVVLGVFGASGVDFVVGVEVASAGYGALFAMVGFASGDNVPIAATIYLEFMPSAEYNLLTILSTCKSKIAPPQDFQRVLSSTIQGTLLDSTEATSREAKARSANTPRDVDLGGCGNCIPIISSFLPLYFLHGTRTNHCRLAVDTRLGCRYSMALGTVLSGVFLFVSTLASTKEAVVGICPQTRILPVNNSRNSKLILLDDRIRLWHGSPRDLKLNRSINEYSRLRERCSVLDYWSPDVRASHRNGDEFEVVRE
ncbi:hypothetical protein BDZ45DRAFT_688671 [Acephala macrosclerotiorum]|nr:hypothetical protein BDZ45DRAFT_688671 [Acephala macrosclerotiorum]